jgi:coenzyme F420-reducing hydrogenase alpha subunit
MASRSRTIKVDYLARVEGEGGMYVRVKDGKVAEVKLKIFEPPRFFEAFLRGRSYLEAPDITARICGICPVAYQMSSVHAMERALGATVDGPLRELRRLLYCGEWIESHVLHVYLLHAPDFLGYEDAIRMAADHPEVVQSGLQLKKAGNQIVEVLAGREIHPINVRVGGFYRTPTRRDLQPLVERLQWARETARQMVRWTAALPIPEMEMDYEFVALHHPDEYAFNEGRIVSSGGLDLDAAEYEQHFEEIHEKHSNALRSVRRGGGAYFVGPLARYALSHQQLSPLAREAAQEVGLGSECRNPFRSIVVRAVETLYAVDEALRILETYERPDDPFVPTEPCACTGAAATEAPRGVLYHRYTLDRSGSIVNARIVPPTSQNQKQIEDDLRAYVERNLDLSQDELTWKCEQAIRNYDPCISCATHFLRLDLVRE